MEALKKADLIYPDLSYKVIGILFEVYNELGPGYKEQYYQKAIATVLRNLNLKFKESVWTPFIFRGEKIADSYLDFLIEDKIVLEIKRKDRFSRKDIEQVLSYLKTNNLQLGVLAYFTNNGVRFKRILNLQK